MPVFYASQGGKSRIPVRLAPEPNTVLATTVNNPILTAVGVLFENYMSVQTPVDYSQAFTLEVYGGYNTLVVNIPAYNPALYPGASQPMPISGYHAGNWFDPAHSGEGIQVEVGEIGPTGSANNRYITLAWYSYDGAGVPFWLFGSGVFTAGDRSARVQMAYFSQGGFAGNFGAQAKGNAWGSIDVQFPDCNTMNFNYQANAGLPTGVPSGSGAKRWARASEINGLNCR